MEHEVNELILNMGSLGTSAPQRKGLSRYYSGKARSFTCIADVQSLEDLKKLRHNKKRKKHSDPETNDGGGKNNNVNNLPPYACRRVPSCAQFATPCVNV